MDGRRFGTLVVAALLVAGACQQGGGPAGGAGGQKGTLKIGIELPLSGTDAANGQPTRNGVLLAIKQANQKGGIGGYQLADNTQDDAVNGVHNPDQGAKNVQTLINDRAVFAIVGPYNSNVAKAEIPITNEAGLIQCSPANTNPGLTKPEYGALDVRKRNPTKISYVRVATTDDLQGPAVAEYAYKTLGKKSVYIVDDTETYGKGIADSFEKHFKDLGGNVVKRDGVPKSTTDYTPFLTAAKGLNPDVVFFGGVTATGAGQVRKQMQQAGMGELPYTGGDGLVDGPGDFTGSFINVAGAAAANSFGSVAAIHDIPNPGAFNDAYQKEYNAAPGAYSAPAYACTQIYLKALETVLGQGTNASDSNALREAVRAYVTNTSNRFDTVLGEVYFDQNGDTNQHIISFYKTDMSAKGGKGDWVFDRQQDFTSLIAPGGSPGTSPGGSPGASPAGSESPGASPSASASPT